MGTESEVAQGRRSFEKGQIKKEVAQKKAERSIRIGHLFIR